MSISAANPPSPQASVQAQTVSLVLLSTDRLTVGASERNLIHHSAAFVNDGDTPNPGIGAWACAWKGFTKALPIFTRRYCTREAEPSCTIQESTLWKQGWTSTFQTTSLLSFRQPLQPQFLLLYRPQLLFPCLFDSWHCQCFSSGQWKTQQAAHLRKAKPSRILAPCWMDDKEVVDVPAAGRQEDTYHDVFQQTPNSMPTMDSRRRAEGHRFVRTPKRVLRAQSLPSTHLRLSQNWNTPECFRYNTFPHVWRHFSLQTNQQEGQEMVRCFVGDSVQGPCSWMNSRLCEMIHTPCTHAIWSLFPNWQSSRCRGVSQVQMFVQHGPSHGTFIASVSVLSRRSRDHSDSLTLERTLVHFLLAIWVRCSSKNFSAFSCLLVLPLFSPLLLPLP